MKTKLGLLKAISLATCFAFLLTTIAPSSLYASTSRPVDLYSVPGQPSIPTINPTEVSEDINEATEKNGYAKNFSQGLVLSSVREEDKESSSYEYERYEFENALDLLRPEYASAVIIKSLNAENLEDLLNLKFEVGITVSHGEIVLFTTGNEREIGILPAARGLLDEAAFIAHTHGENAVEGPSQFDLDHAFDSEFVLTSNAAFLYFNGASSEDIQVYSHEDFLNELYEVKNDSPKIDQVAARADLNKFITEMDLYNTALAEERETFRAGSTPLLDSITAKINDGAAYAANPNVTLSLTVGLSIPPGESLEMTLRDGNGGFGPYEAFVTEKVFSFPRHAVGEQSVFVMVRDSSGNDRTIETKIILDRKAPEGGKRLTKDPKFVLDPAQDFSRNEFGFSFTKAGNLIAIGDHRRTFSSQRSGAVELFNSTGKRELIIRNPNYRNYSSFGVSIAYLENGLLAVLASGRSLGPSAIFFFDVDPDSATFGDLISQIPADSSAPFSGGIRYANKRLYVPDKYDDEGHWSNPVYDGRGIVRIFDADRDSPDFGKQKGALLPSSPEDHLNFGSGILTYPESVPPLVAIGSKKYVEIFNVDPASTDFLKLVHKLDKPDGLTWNPGFEETLSIAMTQNYAFVGAPNDDSENGITRAGLVSVFDINSSSSNYGKVIKTLNAPNPVESGHFGTAVVVSGDRLLVGAPDNELGRKIFVYDINPSSNAFGELINVIQGGIEFGTTLFVDGTDVYVGIPANQDNSYQGAALRLRDFSVGEPNMIWVNGKPRSPLPFVNDLNIDLILNFSDDFSSPENLMMAVANHGDDLDSQKEPYQKKKTLRLADGSDGNRGFNVKIWDEAGYSYTWHTTVGLDRQAPTQDGVKAVVTIESGAEVVGNYRPTIQLHAIDNAVSSSDLEVAFSVDGINFTSFQPYATELELPYVSYLGTESGQKTVYAKFRDPARNVSAVFSDTVIYDGKAPKINSILINDGDAITDNFNAKVTIDSSDEFGKVKDARLRIRRKGQPNVEWGDWQAYSDDLNVTLPFLIGFAEVSVQIRDEGGNISSIVTDDIQIVGLTESGDLKFLDAGLYELTLDQDWKDYLAKNMPASLAAKLSSEDKVNVEVALLKEYARQYMADVYDFIFFLPTTRVFQSQLPTFGANFHETVLGLGWAELANIEGIGTRELTDAEKAKFAPFEDLIRKELGVFMTEIRESGRHQGTGLIDTQSIRNQELDLDAYVDYVMLHELHHRWGTFLSGGGKANSNPLGILGRDHAHWNPFFDAEFSPMDAFNWRDNGNGTFTMTHFQGIDWQQLIDYLLGRRSTLPVTAKYNDFDLYAMGLLDKKDVKSSFMIDNPRTLGNRALNGDTFLDFILGDPNFILGSRTIKGTRRDVTIQDIIDIEGERDPLAADSQKDFNIAFVYVKDTADGSVNNDQKKTAARWQNAINSIWNTATRGLSTMSAGFTSAAFEAFKTNVLDLFNKQAVGSEGKDPAEITRGNNFITLLDNLDALIKQIDDLLAPLIERAKHGGLVVRFVESITEPLDLLKSQLNQFREALEAALANVKNSDDFIDQKRDDVLSLVLQSAVTGLLPAGFGSSVDAIIALVKNIFTDLKLANDNFSGVGSSAQKDLEALLAKVKGPIVGHSFDILGDSKVDSSESVFGGTSVRFDGAGDSLRLEDSSDWAIGTKDFTIDFQFKFNNLDSIQTFFSMNGSSDIVIAKDGANRLLVMVGDKVITQTAWSIKKDAWSHLALTRSNGQVRVFIDGVQLGSTIAAPHNITKTSAIDIGRWTGGARFFNGWLDELRITEGVAKWTSNFTPPTEEYGRDGDTSFLLHFTPEEFTESSEVDDVDPATEPPEGTVAINGGSTSTQDPDVTLALSVADNLTVESAIEMAISVNGGTTFGSFESFNATKNVTLPSGEGTKTIVVRYRDEDGNTADFLDTIILDQTAPTGSVSIANGEKYASLRQVALTLTANDAVSSNSALQMAISVDGGKNFSGFENFAASKNVTLPSDEGTKTVVVKYRDEAGNTVDVSDTIYLDQIAPTGSVSINAGAALSKVIDVTLTLNASDNVSASSALQMAISVDGGTTFSAFESFTASKNVTLPSGNEEKTVVVRYRDEAGNVAQFSDTINLQVPVPPYTPKTFSVNGDARAGNDTSALGGTAGIFDGLGDYLGLQNSQDWAFGTGDFTIDFRFKFNNLDSIQTFFSMNGANDIAIAKDGANRLLVMIGGSVITQTAVNFKKDTWTHLAVTRADGQVRVFVDGVEIGSAKSTRDIKSAGIVHIGQWTTGSRSFNGLLDEFRISKGKARWISNFTPPADEVMRDDDTSFLLRFTEEEFNEGSEASAVDPATVAPEGTISINGGASVTQTLDATLTLSVADNLTAENAIEMAISLDGGTTFGAFENFVSSKDITFSLGNGTKTVVVRYRDEDGNTADFSDTITLDYTDPATVPPSGTVSINGGNGVTASPDVTLSLSVADNLTAENKIKMAISVDGGTTFGSFENFTSSKNVTLPLGNGTKTVVVRYRDTDGNTADVSDTITLDFKDPSEQPPQGTVSINSGDTHTNNPDITLTLSVTDNLTDESNIEMAISVDGGATFSSFENFSTSKNVTLSSGDGAKTVVVRYRDADGNTADFSDTIILDETAPASNGSVTIENGATHATSRTVTLTLVASDAISPNSALQMAISVDSGASYSDYESFASSKNVTLPSGEGIKQVRVRYKDEAGNEIIFADTILLDQLAPTGSISIEAGAASTETASVSLDLSVSDVVSVVGDIKMAISVDGGTTFSAFESFSATKNVTLPSGNGVKTVIVRYLDEAGNTADFSDTINLQVPLPPFTPKTFSVNGNAAAVSDDTSRGATAGSFDGLGDYLGLQNSSDWAFGTGDFTIDFRFKFNNLESIQTFFSMNGANDIAIAKDGANRLLVMMGGNVITQTAVNFKKDTWMHFAMTRSNGQVRVFVDGAQIGAARSIRDIKSTGVAHIGQWTNGHRAFNGLLDEFRISKGSARWTSNFIPPTGEHERDDDTSFLLRFSEDEFAAGAEVDDADPSTVAPEGTVSIDGGSAGTQDRNVTLALSVTDNLTTESAIEMAISVDGGNTFGSFESFNATKNVTLPSGEGTKTVVVRYRDGDGNTADFSDTIALDQTVPTGSVLIKNGAELVSSRSVALTLSASDTVSQTSVLQMAISVDGGKNFSEFESFAVSKNVMLPSGEGTKTVVVRYRDEAGNTADVSDTIILDQTAPTGSVSINSGAVTSETRDVTLTLSANDDVSASSALQMAISVDGGTTFSEFENFATSKDVTLPSGNGVKTVVVKYQDEAGNITSVSDTIDLQVPKPLFTPKEFTVHGDTLIDASESFFGGSSVRFDGLGDYLNFEASNDWPEEINDFTIDFRVKFDNLDSIQTFFSMSGANEIAIAKDGANRMLVMMGGTVITQTAANFKKDEWMHIAVTRSNGEVRVFVNGTQIGSTTKYTRSISANNVAHIGQWTNGYRGFNGWMDEFHIMAGAARWTSNFTPPTSEYTRDDDTDFLLHFTQAEFAAGTEI